jgi:hypothetical protein
MAAIVPNVPGIPGNRPTPNQIEEIRAILSKRPCSLIAFVMVNISDSVIDIKHGVIGCAPELVYQGKGS